MPIVTNRKAEIPNLMQKEVPAPTSAPHPANVTSTPLPLGEGQGERLWGVRPFFYQTASPDRYELLKEYARENRQKPTEAERILWMYLTPTQTGQRWRRQHVIGDFIVDFVCLKEQIVVEVDGAYHSEPTQQEEDTMRTATLESYGFHVIRFTNEEVMQDTLSVLEQIQDIIDQYNS